MALVKAVEWDNVPRQIRDKVCGPYKCVASDGERMIADYEDVLGGAKYGRLPRHSKCGRPSFTFVYRCESCDCFFIRDFSHPNFCPIHACCWECMSSLSEPYCGEKDSVYISRITTIWGIWGPAGMNPKKYDDDELNATLAELGLDFTL